MFVDALVHLALHSHVRGSKAYSKVSREAAIALGKQHICQGHVWFQSGPRAPAAGCECRPGPRRSPAAAASGPGCWSCSMGSSFVHKAIGNASHLPCRFPLHCGGNTHRGRSDCFDKKLMSAVRTLIQSRCCSVRSQAASGQHPGCFPEPLVLQNKDCRSTSSTQL